jgi:predicted N-formylglutamate amidohydrolase
VSPADRRRHVAWDVGAAGVARELSRNLDATLVQQNYSRLVIDSNRPFENPASIPVLSEDVAIPGNRDLEAEDIERRRDEIFRPYHGAIETLLDGRTRANRATTLVAVHSFTPTYHGESRPWDIGLLYHRETRLARALLRILAEETTLCVGDNEPYQVTEYGDYGIPVHAERRGLPCILLEVRHDHIEDAAGQADWAALLSSVLQKASRYEALTTSSEVGNAE